MKPRSDPADTGPKVPSKDLVRSYQTAIARHVVAHNRAVAGYEQTIARRERTIGAQDQAVLAAKQTVDRAVMDMAEALGADLTAELLGMDKVEVRRLFRSRSTASSDP